MEAAAQKLERPSHAARLDVQNLRQRAGGRDLLAGVALTVLPGECVGLLGPSGSGKSTLLKACCGLTRPAAGAVLLNGQDLYKNRDPWRKRLGYVPQDDIIHLELTVQSAIGYAAALRLPASISKGDLQLTVTRAIAQVGLTDRAGVRIAKLSGGQRKRASVAVELLARPAILFLDEPTSGQDPHLEESMMQLFRTLARGGTTIVVTTHAMANVELLDLVALLHSGSLVYFGPPADLLEFFDTRSYEGVFKRLAAEPASHWLARFHASAQWKTYVAGRARGPAIK
jgi:ABC-type multidrug transport system ATPase subunit